MILILAAYIALLSFAVHKFAGKNREKWINAGFLTAFVLPLVVFFLLLNILGILTGAGMGSAAAGLLFGAATCITGFVFLYIGYTANPGHS
ncbi:hypothetical protein AUC31_02050 [Planococcus rifietoensis]|uniref:YesK-like protein n=1 Tax=Planococcus rifietoensis TaxID=200991 RepID=A0A0U2YR73_9BACL|nr:hypothetical protein [Planococcus rifietoensis]ALS74110.1 hypothetical protein AUC31_02050 [Planococcus rifietoensis]